MQNKGVKSVFKVKNGFILGHYPIGHFGHTFNLISFFQHNGVSSVRVVVGNMVIEAHTDKHNNIIYREYEKKK